MSKNGGKSNKKTKPAGPLAAGQAGPWNAGPPAAIVPIAGIGASAGGIEAFTQLLRAIPQNTGMAFVLVQHLEARHESIIAKLLSSATAMPVTEVKQGTRAEANRVYVIPPGADIAISNGVLHLASREAPAGRHMPIDLFFRSLAEDRGPGAIGVILSGTASDGTLGLNAIKVEGGITFAQEPMSAKFDGMPRSAIAAGCVDFVLPPEEIARELARIGRHPYIGLAPHTETDTLIADWDRELIRILRLLRVASGVDLTYYKKTAIKRRVARRMALHRIESPSSYVKFLETNGEEIAALYHDILIHVTGFFREPGVFAALHATVFPQILAGKSQTNSVRIWVPGCSSGEEVYSIAICLLESLGERASNNQIQIFGTDISQQAIDRARSGIYPESALHQVSAERLRRFFIRSNGHYQVDTAIREACVFARHDLTRDPPFSRLDLISCRNVLIYLEPVPQKKVLGSLHYALREPGFLLLGKSETLGGYPDLFTLVDGENKFFTRNAGLAGQPFSLAPAPYEKPAPAAMRIAEEVPAFDVEREADRVVWEHYAHAGLVIGDDLQILHFRGDTSPYVRPASDKSTFNLLRVLRDELVYEVRAALTRARRDRCPVSREGIRFKHSGLIREVSLRVQPLAGAGSQKHFLVLFEATRPNGDTHAEPSAPRRKTAVETEIGGLKDELARTKAYLQAIADERETTNEELRSANEEALSCNEELLSANEELETAKEELQSTNEELVSLNEQAQNRNADLGQLSDDLTNVLSGVNIPILILGSDRRIRRFTPTAEKLLHLLPADIGRPVGDIRLGLAIPDLDDLISTVVHSGRELERDVRACDSRWYSIRMRPYRTKERKIEGVLLVLVDIDELKRIQEALRKEGKFVTSVLDAALDLLVLVVDREGRIVRFNRTCQEVSGYSLAEATSRILWDFLLAPEEVAGVQAVFAELLAGKAVQSENYWLAKDGRRRLIAWSATVTRDDAGSVEYLIHTGIDVTERQQAKEWARESEATMGALLENTAQAILVVNVDGHIVMVNEAAESMFGYRKEEIVGRQVEDLIPLSFREPHVQHWAGYFEEPRHRPMGKGLELAGLRQDGSQFPVEIGLSHRVATREGTLAVAFITDITERKLAENALRESEAAARIGEQRMRVLSAGLLAAQEKERKRISRDLHDDLNQRLAMLAVHVAQLETEIPASQGGIRAHLQTLQASLTGLSDDVRRTAYQLHPSVLEHLGLAAAVESYCADFSKQETVEVRFKKRNVPARIPEGVALCLYRVVQESLRNVARHSGAGKAAVTLTGSKNGISLTIGDSGKGFDPGIVKRKGGLGLVSMEERVRAADGNLTIATRPGDGTRIEIRIPLRAERPKTSAASSG